MREERDQPETLVVLEELAMTLETALIRVQRLHEKERAAAAA